MGLDYCTRYTNALTTSTEKTIRRASGTMAKSHANVKITASGASKSEYVRPVRPPRCEDTHCCMLRSQPATLGALRRKHELPLTRYPTTEMIPPATTSSKLLELHEGGFLTLKVLQGHVLSDHVVRLNVYPKWMSSYVVKRHGRC